MTSLKIFTNLHVVDPSSMADGASAILVSGGEILAVGSAEKVKEQLGKEAFVTIDMGGKFVLPGFVDPHAHPLMYGQMMDWVDVGPSKARDIPQIIQILKRVDQELPIGAPLRAFGYEHRNLSEGRHPTCWDLDQIGSSREIYVMNASGHGGVVNSIVLKSNHISEKTIDPAGGRFERDEEGVPTGVIWDAACDILTGANGVKLSDHGPNFHLPDSLDVLTQQLLQAEIDFISNGTTSIGDAQVSKREFDVYKNAYTQRKTKCRYSFFITSALLEEATSLKGEAFIDGLFMTANGIKLYADGTLGGWTAYFPDGYAVDKKKTGQLYHSKEDYQRLFLAAAKKGFHIATHAQSPTAIGMVIDATRILRTLDYKTFDGTEIIVRIEHCGLPLTSQSKEFAELGIISVSQPLHHHNWGDGVVTAVGKELGGRFNPLGEFVREGVSFALSSDAPVAKPRPFQAIAAAVDRHTVHGNYMGDENLAIDVRTALIAHTMGGARALGKAEIIGSLESGKKADFITVSKNPLTLNVEELRALSVEATWINGEKVF